MLRVTAFAFALCCLPATAQAHPHVWIDMRSSVNFNDKGAVDAIAVSWTFDEFYSQLATDGIDANNNKKFDPSELQALAVSYAKNLKAYGYFMHVETGCKAADIGAPQNPRATFDKGKLTFTFNLPFARPVDPTAIKLRYTSFDPTYYVDIAPAAGSTVAFTGAAPKACSAALRKVDSTRAGALNLAQSVKMVPPTSDVLNATNAAVIDITCATRKVSVAQP